MAWNHAHALANIHRFQCFLSYIHTYLMHLQRIKENFWFSDCLLLFLHTLLTSFFLCQNVHKLVSMKCFILISFILSVFSFSLKLRFPQILLSLPRMPRHIRELFVCAGAKIQNRLEKSANNNKEYGQKVATSVYFFLFHGHIYFSGQRVPYGTDYNEQTS